MSIFGLLQAFSWTSAIGLLLIFRLEERYCVHINVAIVCGGHWLQVMDRVVSIGKLLNVAVLDQVEVENDNFLVILLGNPFIDTVDPEEK